MVNVTSRTANWRLFGGSALIIAAILWIIAIIASPTGWLLALAWIVLAAGLVIVALGETTGNGAVGKYVPGKIALIVFAAGWLILAINQLYALPSIVIIIAALFIIVGGLFSAWAIYRKSVAKGAARWFMFVPAIVGAIVFLPVVITTLGAAPAYLSFVLAVLFGITGALYLLNDRKIG
jgi:hypothetical protein